MTTTKQKPVLIFDTHRGIYFGYLISKTNAGKTVKLKRARHCYYYPAQKQGHKGAYGLATLGPADGAKVGPEVTMTINDVSKIVDCTKEAAGRWAEQSW